VLCLQCSVHLEVLPFLTVSGQGALLWCRSGRHRNRVFRRGRTLWRKKRRRAELAWRSARRSAKRGINTDQMLLACTEKVYRQYTYVHRKPIPYTGQHRNIGKIDTLEIFTRNLNKRKCTPVCVLFWLKQRPTWLWRRCAQTRSVNNHRSICPIIFDTNALRNKILHH